jgi:hypothetical protein
MPTITIVEIKAKNTFEVDVPDDSTNATLKYALSSTHNLPLPGMRLIWNDSFCQDDATLSSLDICDGCVVKAYVRRVVMPEFPELAAEPPPPIPDPQPRPVVPYGPRQWPDRAKGWLKRIIAGQLPWADRLIPNIMRCAKDPVTKRQCRALLVMANGQVTDVQTWLAKGVFNERIRTQLDRFFMTFGHGRSTDVMAFLMGLGAEMKMAAIEAGNS